MKKNRKLLLGVLCLICLAALLLCVWIFARPAPQAGSKNITVSVVHSDGSTRDFDYWTEASYLAEVLTEEGLIDGEEGEFGLFVLTVDGETTDYERDGSWWCLTKGGQEVTTGVSETALADGDHYEWTYTVG